MGTAPQPVAANHSLAGFHWPRSANPFTRKLGDNVDARWDAALATASSDWTRSSVLDTKVVAGRAGGLPTKCKPTLGRVEVCNWTYGINGWLGFANIWVIGTHITQGRVKLNDSYFDTADFNTPAWRGLVACQEVGHTFGLDHQDEIFDNPNLGTCMDYTRDPSTNQHPNQHDYGELELIYGHLDSSAAATTSASSGAPATSAGEDPDQTGDDGDDWGAPLRESADGRPDVFERDIDDVRMFTFVFWAPPA